MGKYDFNRNIVVYRGTGEKVVQFFMPQRCEPSEKNVISLFI